MYLIVENPEVVDNLGNIVPEGLGVVEEGPPMPSIPGLRLVNSIGTRRILIDDSTKALYKRDDGSTEFFYIHHYPPEYSLSEEKILYVFLNPMNNTPQPVMFLDKYGLEWKLMLESDLRGITALGVPIVKARPEASTSGFTFRTPMAVPRPTPSAPPIHTARPVTSTHHVSFAKDGGMPRPIGSEATHATSGHPASRVPTGPLPTSSLHPPMVSTGSKHEGSLGGGRNKTRPSHFQKWVKKFSGSGDPYDHLASFKQITRAEEVTDVHVLREGFG